MLRGLALGLPCYIGSSSLVWKLVLPFYSGSSWLLRMEVGTVGLLGH